MSGKRVGENLFGKWLFNEQIGEDEIESVRRMRVIIWFISERVCETYAREFSGLSMKDYETKIEEVLKLTMEWIPSAPIM